MADTNPDRNQQLLEFAELHAPVWRSFAASIGLTEAQSVAYSEAFTQAKEKYNAALTIRMQAKVATQEQTEAIGELRRLNSSLLRIIRGFAQGSSDPATVYNTAQIAPPAQPGPPVPPTAPFDLSADLAIADGGIRLRWKASQPAGVTGVVYRVERAMSNAGPWMTVGLTGSKSTVDTTIPNGTSRVMYRIIAQRGNFASASSTVLDIRFGTGPGMLDVSQLKMVA